MPRGHSRLALNPPTTAADWENDDEELFVPSRAASPSAVAAASTDAGLLIGVLPLAGLLRCYEINTAGAVAVTQCFLPLLKESKGRIINVCSSAGLTAAPINGSYAASKMALQAVSDSLRVELYPFGISVSIIEPGSLDANAWSPNNPVGAKLDNDKDHSYQLNQQGRSTPAPNATPLPPSTPTPSGLSITTSPRRPSLTPVNGDSSPTVARFRALSPSAFPVGGLSLHPHGSPTSPHRPNSPPEPPVSPQRRAPPPPRSWSSLSHYGHTSQVPIHHDEPPVSPRSPTMSRSSSADLRAGPSFIPVPTRLNDPTTASGLRNRRSSLGPTSSRIIKSPIGFFLASRAELKLTKM
ncbi:hypothetical protein HDU96_004063 [Phlyctochytrium bullatum]|nr:hypothetical protein HDU96_004063 [Phlyctochytrium bullatum]